MGHQPWKGCGRAAGAPWALPAGTRVGVLPGLRRAYGGQDGGQAGGAGLGCRNLMGKGSARGRFPPGAAFAGHPAVQIRPVPALGPGLGALGNNNGGLSLDRLRLPLVEKRVWQKLTTGSNLGLGWGREREE